MESGKSTKAKEAEIKTLEGEVETLTKEASSALGKLPLIKDETEEGKGGVST